MNYTVQHQFNYQIPLGEVNDLPSLTVPDDSMSLETILKRYALGLPINGNNQEEFYEEEELPDLRKMDMEEIAVMKMETEEKIQKYRDHQAKVAEAKKHIDLIDQYEKNRKPDPEDLDMKTNRSKDTNKNTNPSEPRA